VLFFVLGIAVDGVNGVRKKGGEVAITEEKPRVASGVLVRAPLALRCGCRNVGGAAGPHCCESPPGVMARVPGTCTTELRVSRAMGWFYLFLFRFFFVLWPTGGKACAVCYQGSSFRRPCVVWFGPEQARYGKSTAVVAAPSSWYLTVFYVGDLSGGGRAGGC